MQVKTALDHFRRLHKKDPSDFLNYYFWSVKVEYERYERNLEKYDQWCSDQFDPNDWIRINTKIWFSTQHQYAHFRLVWEDNLDKNCGRKYW